MDELYFHYRVNRTPIYITLKLLKVYLFGSYKFISEFRTKDSQIQWVAVSGLLLGRDFFFLLCDFCSSVDILVKSDYFHQNRLKV